jgi:2-iminobutanoate/2-iminopropanoate deaminase
MVGVSGRLSDNRFLQQFVKESAITNALRLEPVFPTGGPAPAGAYSPAVTFGDFVFVSGQAPIDPATGSLVQGSIEQRTLQTLANLGRVLEAAGSSLAGVVKVTAHLEDFALFDGFDAAYRATFADPLPARTTVQSGLGGIQVEIDAVAVRSVQSS